MSRGSKIVIFKNVGEHFSSVGGSKIHVCRVFPDPGKIENGGNGCRGGSKIVIFKNAGECFSSVGGSEIHVFRVFPNLV